MAENMTELPSKRRSLAKIRPSDGCKGDGVPLAVDQRCDFHEFGCHLRNVTKVYFGADSVFANRFKLLQLHQTRHHQRLSGKFISSMVYG